MTHPHPGGKLKTRNNTKEARLTCGECEDGTCICGIPEGCPECLGRGKCGTCQGTMDVPDAGLFVQPRRVRGPVGCQTCQRTRTPLPLPLTFNYSTDRVGPHSGALTRARRALRCQGCHREIPPGMIPVNLTYRLEERVSA